MAEQITIEEVLDLVEFRYSSIADAWRVAKVRGNSAMEVIGDCWSVEGVVCHTINGRGWVPVESPKQKLERLIKERAPYEELLDALNEMEDDGETGTKFVQR